MWSRGIVGSLCLILALPAQAQTEAAAQDPCETSPACMLHANRARALAKSGKHEEAAVEFSAAYIATASPWLLFNQARALQKSGHFDQAADAYQLYLERGQKESPEQRQKATEYLQQLRPRAAPRAADGSPVASSEQAEPPPAPLMAAPPPPPKPAAVPVYKKWWFWTILGGIAAAGVATGVGLGVYASGADPTGLPEGRPFGLSLGVFR